MLKVMKKMYRVMYLHGNENQLIFQTFKSHDCVHAPV